MRTKPRRLSGREVISLGHYLALGHRFSLPDVSFPRDIHQSVVLVVFSLHLEQKSVNLGCLGLQELWPEASNNGLPEESDALTMLGLIEELKVDWPNFVEVWAYEFFDFVNQILSPGDSV